MDISAPHYNSASESGWTHYLDQSFVSGNYFQMSGGVAKDDEEEDLSMVSNASSGPPIYHDDDYECCYGNWYPNHSSSQHTKEKKMTKKKVKESDIRQQGSHLDGDTASSLVFNCSKKKANFPVKVKYTEYTRKGLKGFGETELEAEEGKA